MPKYKASLLVYNEAINKAMWAPFTCDETKSAIIEADSMEEMLHKILKNFNGEIQIAGMTLEIQKLLVEKIEE